MSQGTRLVEASLPEARSSPTPVLLMGAKRSGITELWAGRMRWLEGWSLAGLSFLTLVPKYQTTPTLCSFSQGVLTARLLPMGPGNADLRSSAREAGTTNGWVEWYQADLGLMITSPSPDLPEFLGTAPTWAGSSLPALAGLLVLGGVETGPAAPRNETFSLPGWAEAGCRLRPQQGSRLGTKGRGCPRSQS